ncbi:MAG TPA: NADAR family protein [Chitinophagaceae bacterium]|nr:NADAR family protein [Chitinophagaceae bacterium]
MNYSISWLQHQYKQGIHAEYFFFWGHTQKKEGIIDKSCFSQWYPSSFTVDGVIYKTAEHWMMAKKTILFNDNIALEKILAAEKPAVAKAVGREVKNFDATIWNASAFSIVVEGNLHKFSQHQPLKAYLLKTGNKIIAEASPTDAIWGIGLAQDAKEASNPFKWRGTNLLGFALMETRDALK